MAFTKKSLSVCLLQTIVVCGINLAARESPSEDAAKILAAAMTAGQLQAIAVADPANPNRFAAALLIPDSQLLVVEADYPNPAELQALIQRQQYRDVYTALQQPSTAPTRTLFLDAGCDGLKVDRETVDVVYERGTNEVLLNGDWKKAKLSESEYQQKTQTAVTEFGRVVTLLRDSIGGTHGR